MTDQTCSKCGKELNRPYERNANYVVSDDLAEKEPREVHYALVHTEDTKRVLDRMDNVLESRNRDALNAEMAHPDAPDRIDVSIGKKQDGLTETADIRSFPFSIDVDRFEKVEVDDPEVVKKEDDVAIVLKEVEEREVKKTGLICEPCTTEDDEIIWGADG